MAWEQWRAMPARRNAALLAASGAFLCLLVWAAWAVDLRDPYLRFAVGGAGVFYLRLTSCRREKLVWILISLFFGPWLHWPALSLALTGAGLLSLFGWGAFLMLGLRVLWSAEEERRRAVAALAPAAAVVFFVFSAQHALSLGNLLYPKTYDLYLFVFDGSLGFQPSFVAGQVMARSRVLASVTSLIYLSLPFFMAVVYALRLPRDAEKPSWDIICLFLLAGMAGSVLYNVVPATGPKYVFQTDFPWQALPFHSLPRLLLERIPIAGDVPRNAMPSLHMTWVLLLWWNSRSLAKSLRLLVAAFTVLTAFATLATGEHYLVDLVASLPFAMLVQATVAPDGVPRRRLRLAMIAAGAGLTAGWLLLARCAAGEMLMSPLLPWSLVILTCVVVGAFRRASLPVPVTSPGEAVSGSSPIRPAGENESADARLTAGE